MFKVLEMDGGANILNCPNMHYGKMKEGGFMSDHVAESL
jgi:hypothetical protein